MKTEDIKILEIGLGLSDEIDIPEILEGDTNNTTFMCGCHFHFHLFGKES